MASNRNRKADILGDLDNAVRILFFGPPRHVSDGSGIGLREDLKAAGVSVPVIYITGNANPMVREAALASGCVAFLTKPFSSRELIEPLKKASAGR